MRGEIKSMKRLVTFRARNLTVESLVKSPTQGQLSYIVGLVVLACATIITKPSFSWDYLSNPLSMVPILLYLESQKQANNPSLSLSRMRGILAVFLVATIVSVFDVIPVDSSNTWFMRTGLATIYLIKTLCDLTTIVRAWRK